MAKRLVVVGDALLDVDIVGHASRLAPDAPAPVIDAAQESARPGGAALAASLLAHDGLDVTLITALGTDRSSRQLRGVLPENIELVELPLCGELPRKVRVRAGTQCLARLDYGDGRACPDDGNAVRTVLRNAATVLVSDYGRGITSLLRDDLAEAANVTPMVWDPHPRGAIPVAGASAVTPNVAEAEAFAADQARTGFLLRRTGDDARRLVDRWGVRSVCVTMGAAGALLSYGDDSPLVIPAPPVYCTDPCGAGDRFAGTFASALASGALPSEAARAAVLAASAFVEIGVNHVFETRAAPVKGDVFARISAARDSGGTIVATGGCFDLLHAGHIETLRAARSLGDFLVVCLNSDSSVKRLKGDARPLVGQADRAHVLEALECVDAVVIFDEETPAEVLTRIRPHIWAKGGDYSGRNLPEASVLAEWGGQAVVLPYLAGKSTTALIDAASAKALGRKGVSR